MFLILIVKRCLEVDYSLEGKFKITSHFWKASYIINNVGAAEQSKKNMSHGTINRAWTNLQASENVSTNSNPIYINVASKYKKSAIDPVHYGSHVRLTGFEFCKHLENSTFDSSVHLDQFKGSIQTAQPSLSSVVDMIESAALEFTFTVISQLDRKQAILPVVN